jgi:2-hydroxy-3-oxopropionate reductase
MSSVSGRVGPSVRVGFLGLGTMGMPMVANVLSSASAASVIITGRSKARVEAALAGGATWAATPRELATQSDFVVVMLPDLPELESILAGPDGLLAGVSHPLLLGIGSTSSPDGVRTLAARLLEQTAGLVHVIDMPVSGGEDGAIAGSLSILVGGTEADFETARPTLAAMGHPVLLGPLGAGEVGKACNQMIVAATILALGEACVIADRSGLDVGALLDLLSGGYAGSRVLETRKERLINKDYRPSGAARYMVKDLTFASAEAAKSGTVASQLETLLAQFSRLTASGFGDQDMSVTRAYVESRSVGD